MKIVVVALLTLTLARDLGQWKDAPADQRAWAEAQQIPAGPDKGKSCCSDADSSGVVENIRKDGLYWIVFIIAEGTVVGPMPVPPELVLQGSKFGPKVWWYNDHGVIKIRCYAPGPGI